MNALYRPHAIVLAVCCITAYLCWPSASSPLVFDDISNLVPITDTSLDGYRAFVFGNDSGPTGRPVSMLSFALNHLARGDFKSFDLKITNLFIHLLCGVIIFLLARSLFSRASAPLNHDLSAAVVAGIWLLNPLNTHLTFYAVQRMTQLSCLFVLLGLFSYVTARSVSIQPSTRTTLFLTTIFCWVAAFFAKENGILFPFYIIVLEAYFLSTIQKSARLRFCTGFAVLAGFALGIAATHINLFDYSNRPFSIYERIFTQPVVITEYIRELLLPTSSDVGVFQDDYEVKKTLKSVPVILSIGIIAISIIVSLVGPQKANYRAIWGGILLFFGAHAVESTIVPLEMYFQHRNYFPSVGLYIAVVAAANTLLNNTFLKRFIILLACIHVLISINSTFKAANGWKNYSQFVSNSYAYHPTSVRASTAMIELLTQSQQFDAALHVNELAVSANPDSALRLAAQRFYVFCRAQRLPKGSDYEYFKSPIKPLNFVEISTAIGNLFSLEENNKCPSIDFELISNKIAKSHDSAAREGKLTGKQSWAIEYYLIDYYRRHGRDEIVRKRLKNVIELGSEKAVYYQKEFKIEI